ncbi:SubName: Full=Uncharacterized protein {ECO:0000313/EMBL:CCA69449.1} [Serendipita indica DSM 11827]|nr:SubName: Full=Uncharacterized protein {ECO:0000313/EMBL:CCA69449.1} [Serendipita indica DSM 11827]
MENALEVADWGDDDDLPQATEESTAGGADADALSLASDDNDLEALKKYHNQTWNDGQQTQEPPASGSASQMLVESQPEPTERAPSPKDPPVTQKPQKIEELPLHPTLPPKPVATVFTSMPVLTVSAEAMAPPRAHARANNEGREPVEYYLKDGRSESRAKARLITAKYGQGRHSGSILPKVCAAPVVTPARERASEEVVKTRPDVRDRGNDDQPGDPHLHGHRAITGLVRPQVIHTGR